MTARTALVAASFATACSAAFALPAAGQGLVAFGIEGDRIPAPLVDTPGDPARGRAIALDRGAGACILCHVVPDSGERFMGDIAPPLAGVGERLTPAQLRLRVVDSSRVNPATPMPAYYRTQGLAQVARAYRDKPILSAQQVEDVVAWLATLKASGR